MPLKYSIEPRRRSRGCQTLDWPNVAVPNGNNIAIYSRTLNRRVFLDDVAAYHTRLQVENPVKVLSSGLEVALSKPDAPYFIGGKMAHDPSGGLVGEIPDSKPVIFGHYWRKPAASNGPPDLHSLFQNERIDQWLGPVPTAIASTSALVVDFENEHLDSQDPCLRAPWPPCGFPNGRLSWTIDRPSCRLRVDTRPQGFTDPESSNHENPDYRWVRSS